MTYYDFDFKRDKDFFKSSSTYQYLKDSLESNSFLTKIEPSVFKASLNLWVESIIKHNLSANCANIDTYSLISEENSSSVLKIFGKIFVKEKSKKTTQDFEILRHQAAVQNSLVMVSLSNLDNQDIWADLKKEFVQFKLEHALENNKKPKP